MQATDSASNGYDSWIILLIVSTNSIRAHKVTKQPPSSHNEAQDKMHAFEHPIGTALVTRLLSGQFPQWAERPISLVCPTGTVNAVLRLGDDLCVQLPRVADWAECIERESSWLPYLAPHLSLRIPRPEARGKPADDYPHPWVIYEWLTGASCADEPVQDEVQRALDLAQFILEIRLVAAKDAPRVGRRLLRELDEKTRNAIAERSSNQSCVCSHGKTHHRQGVGQVRYPRKLTPLIR